MNVSIIGSGAFGSALSIAAVKSGSSVILCAEGPSYFLPHIDPYQKIKKCTDIKDALEFSDIIVLAVPAQAVREVVSNIKSDSHSYVIASKGIELSTGLFMHEVINDVLESANICAIAGPNLAGEIIAGHEFGITIASPNAQLRNDVSTIFSIAKTDMTDDLIGVEALSAIKNVMAIGCGLIRQTSESRNVISTFLSMCAHEMSCFARHVGGRDETAFTFAGIGDFILTCAGTESRNVQFGMKFGKQEFSHLAEGAFTAQSAILRCPDLSIVNAINNVISNKLTIKDFYCLLLKNKV